MKYTKFFCSLLVAAVLTAAYAEEKKPKDTAKPATEGKEGNWEGTIVASPTGQGHFGLNLKDDPKTMVLWADDMVLRQLEKAKKDNAGVKVSGTLAADGINVKVASVTELEKPNQRRSKAKKI